MDRKLKHLPLNTENADRLSQACETTQDKLIIWTLLDTGLRVSELTSLTPQHVCWQQHTLPQIKGKSGKQRIVPLSKRVQSLLEHYFAIHEKWPVGTRQVQKRVTQIADNARISQKVTPHTLRHTFATLALQKGISLPAVQKIMGHEKLTTTAIYLNFIDHHIVQEFRQKW